MVRQAFSVSLLVLAALGSLSAQEPIEIRNWPAPPFFSLPKSEKPEAASSDPATETFSAEGEAGPAPLPLVPIFPCRIADTRGNGFSGQAGPQALNTGPRVFQIAGTVPGTPSPCGIPLTARAVSFQFTIVTPNSAGNLIAWPEGVPPTISVLNWSAGESALGNGTVVPISPTGSLSVQINSGIAGATGHLVLDVNGYYTSDLDSRYVNENQFSSVTGTMIADGAILNVDLSPVAQIADTKLATIATAGKVADTALSANVTKLGPTIESGEITDVLRMVPLPLNSFVDCTNGATIDFNSGTDARPDLSVSGGTRRVLFESTAGSPDQNTEIWTSIMIPTDYASGAGIFVKATKAASTGDIENLTCKMGTEADALLPPFTVATVAGVAIYSCGGPSPPVIGAGSSLRIHVSVTSPGVMNDALSLLSLSFAYQAVQ
jgi:hypothetical protein